MVLLSGQENYDEALRVLGDGLKIKDKHIPFLVDAARIQVEKSNFEPAEQACKMVLAQVADHHEALSILGRICQETDRPEEAVVYLRQAVEATAASVVLTSATSRGREVSAAVACALGAGLAPDAIDLRVEGGKLVAVRSLYSGNILADITFESGVQFASVRPRSFPMPAAGVAQGAIHALEFSGTAGTAAEQVLESRSTDSGEVNLIDAKIIVSGGRGVASDPVKGFALVAELATVLGAAMGASRAAVDAGYIPYKHQVGQTGKTVKPDLYIAVGISGSIQHLAGMGSSKLIVAINKDREAPIFERAHYGIVGDLYEVLPALTAAFRQRLK